ncbi:MAG: hypothetical protein JJU42_11355 [Rhodobacteraceae bacterium]|nr:hypothetical protein [Paracoccaceae bacterium]
MTLTANVPARVTPKRRKDGLIGLWGRIIHRDRDAYERWLAERDLTAITACLLRLNERQLNRLGFSHATLGMDVEDLALRAKHEAQIGMDVLRIVEDDAPMVESHRHAAPERPYHAIAAE